MKISSNLYIAIFVLTAATLFAIYFIGSQPSLDNLIPRIESAIAQGDWQAAADNFSKIKVKKIPDYETQASVLALAGTIAGAPDIKDKSRSIVLRNGEELAKIMLSQDDAAASTHYELGRILRFANRFQEAEAALKSAVELSRKDSSEKNLASLLEELAINRYDGLADFQGAAEAAKESLELDEERPVATRLLGSAYIWLGSFNKAEDVFEEGEKRFGNVPFPFAAAKAYLLIDKLQNPTQALAAIDRVEKESDESFITILLRSQAELLQNNLEKSEALAKKANSLFPEQPAPYELLALIALEKNSYDEALVFLEEGLTRITDRKINIKLFLALLEAPMLHARLLFLKGLTLLYLKNENQAHDAFAESFKINPHLAEIKLADAPPKIQTLIMEHRPKALGEHQQAGAASLNHIYFPLLQKLLR